MVNVSIFNLVHIFKSLSHPRRIYKRNYSPNTLWLYVFLCLFYEGSSGVGDEFWRDLCHCIKCNNERSICIIYKRVESSSLGILTFPLISSN